MPDKLLSPALVSTNDRILERAAGPQVIPMPGADRAGNSIALLGLGPSPRPINPTVFELDKLLWVTRRQLIALWPTKTDYRQTASPER